MGVKITVPSAGGGPDPTALKKASNLSDLTSVPTALTNLGISTIPGRVTALEGKNVRSTRFEIISSGTSGTVTLPTGSTVILDDFGGTVDAITAEVAGGRPVFNHPRDASGNIVTATFDSSGNWVLSAAPTSYPIAVIYRVRQSLLNFNASDASIVGEYQTSVTDNAGTATALQTARTINGTSFDGTANITVTAAAGTLTGTTLNSSVVSSSLTSVGTLTTGVWNASTIPVANGGTGQTSYTNGQLLIGNTTGNTLAKATLTDGYGHATTNGAGSITLAVSLTSTDTSSTTVNTTTSTTNALLTNSISGTPAAGTYLVMFSCSMGLNSTSAAQTYISLFTGPSGSTTQVSETERRVRNGSGGQGSTVVFSVSFQKTITFNGTDIYEIRWRVSAGTSSIFSRTLTLLRIA